MSTINLLNHNIFFWQGDAMINAVGSFREVTKIMFLLFKAKNILK